MEIGTYQTEPEPKQSVAGIASSHNPTHIAKILNINHLFFSYQLLQMSICSILQK